jgi:hypothetical protein
MPLVGTYGTRKVLTDPYPAARKSAAETPTSEGAGLEEARMQKFEGLARVGEVAAAAGRETYRQARIVRDAEAKRADEIALLDAQNKLDQWENPRLYDPQSGALSVHGKDAMPLPEQIAGEYDQVTGAIAMGLGNDRQKLAFAKVKESRGQQLDLTIRKHVYGEMQRYEGQELQSTITNATNNAIANASDPRRVGIELARAVDAIKTHAPRLGLGPEEVAQQVDAVTTKTHVGVIEGLLAQDQTKTAQVYFDETKSAIKGEALARIEKALSVGKTRSEGQKAADAIVAAGGTLTEQREKARAIDDPDVRDNVMQRIEHEDAVKEKVQREAEQATLTNAYGIVDRTKSVDGIPPADVVTLANHMPALRAYAIARAKGVPVETDYPTYYGLLSKAGDDPAAFVKENLLTYRAKLDDGEFKQLADIQLRIKNGDRAAADKATSAFRTHDQIVKDSLTNYGIDPTPRDGSPEAKAIAQFRRMLDLRVAALGQEHPKNDDIQRIADDLLSQSNTIPGSWWNIFPGGKPFFDQTKRVIDYQVSDVPAADRTQIEASLRANGQPVSDAMVLNVYIEHQARRRKK